MGIERDLFVNFPFFFNKIHGGELVIRLKFKIVDILFLMEVRFENLSVLKLDRYSLTWVD